MRELTTSGNTIAKLMLEALASDPSNFDTRIVHGALMAGEFPGAPTAHWAEARDFFVQVFSGATSAGVQMFGSKAAAEQTGPSVSES